METETPTALEDQAAPAAPNAADAAEADPWAEALAEQAAAAQPVQAAAKQPVFEQFAVGQPSAGARHDIDLILDIPVQLTVELGRTRVPIKQVLSMAQGTVIELDGLAGEPMDLMVNGCLIAQGEVVVVNEKFGIRITDIVTPTERMRRLQR
jgi:flagellar motor switch protein FliN/FliY